MNKKIAGILFLLLSIFGLTGCDTVGDKTASMSIIYVAIAVLSLIILIGYFLLVKNRDKWFVILLSAVLVVNTGYAFMSLSSSLEMALMANRIAYFGSVFLPLSMLMIILKTTNTAYTKHLSVILFFVGIIIFLVAASPGILDVYYKEVSFEKINGVGTLVKVYGPLHPLYLFYLLGYFGSMVAVIIRASVKKTIENNSHAVIIAIAVFVNIGVWFIEQISRIEFEMLSVSYIISELFLLGANLVINENQRLREIVKTAETVQAFTPSENPFVCVMTETPVEEGNVDSEKFEVFVKGIERLTQTEKVIYEAYIARVTTKEIMASLNITENTLKYHNRNIYGKLGVSSRKELLEVYKQLKATKEKYSGND